MALRWLAVPLLAVAATASAAPLAVLEVADRYSGVRGLDAFLTEHGIPHTQLDPRRPGQLTGRLGLWIGSFATSEEAVRSWLVRHASQLRRFVRGGGTLVVLAQADQDEARPTWLPRGLRAARGDRDAAPRSSPHPQHALWRAATNLAPADLGALAVGDETGQAARDIPAGLDLFRAYHGLAPVLESAEGLPVALHGRAGAGQVLLLQLAPDKAYDLPASRAAAAAATRLLVNLLACTLEPPTVPGPATLHAAPPRPIAGVVFWDANGNGRRDPAEAPAADVTLSLDHLRAVTAADGSFQLSLSADRTARLAVHPPAGARAPPSALLRGWAPSDAPLALPLRAAPERRADRFAFVALADTHLLAGRLVADRARLAARLAALAGEASPGGAPAFALLLGDNAGTARWPELHAVREVATGAPFPVFALPGNHDATRGPDAMDRHRAAVGPLVQAFEWGAIRVLLGRDFGRDPAARAWLEQELDRRDPERALVVAQHYPPSPALAARLSAAGVTLLIHGHVHRRARAQAGALTVLAHPPALFGGLDRSASGYGRFLVDGRQVEGRLSSWPGRPPPPDAPRDAADAPQQVWRRGLADTTLPAAPVADASTLFLPAAAGPERPFSGIIALDLHRAGAEHWRHQTAAAVRAPPALADDRLLVQTEAGDLLALTTAGGEVRWRQPAPANAIPPVLAGPLAGVTDVLRGTPAAPALFTLAAGAPLWRAARLEGGTMAAFTGSARAADLVLITSRRHGLVALDTHGGTMRWSAPAPFPATAPPAADGARAYACSAAGVRAFDLRDGAELWAAPLPRAIHTVAPLPAGDLVLQATGGGVLVALEAETGAERWRVSTDPALAELGPYRRGGPSTGARPVRHGDQVLFGADDGRLRCVDLGTGTLRWRADLGAPISGCVARGNLVLVALRSGEVVALRPPVHRTEP